jgi:reverse gyrase
VARRLAAGAVINTEGLNKVLYSPVLDAQKVMELVKKSFDEEVKILNIKALDDSEVKEFVAYVNEERMKAALEIQKAKAAEFFKSVNEKPKGKKKGT